MSVNATGLLTIIDCTRGRGCARLIRGEQRGAARPARQLFLEETLVRRSWLRLEEGVSRSELKSSNDRSQRHAPLPWPPYISARLCFSVGASCGCTSPHPVLRELHTGQWGYNSRDKRHIIRITIRKQMIAILPARTFPIRLSS